MTKPWSQPRYRKPSPWDRLLGRQHHDCEYCLDAERFPHLQVIHPPNWPPPMTGRLG